MSGWWDIDEDWTLVDFTDKKREPGSAKMPPAPATSVSKKMPVSDKACPKCGKLFGRGRHLHVKHCKG